MDSSDLFDIRKQESFQFFRLSCFEKRIQFLFQSDPAKKFQFCALSCAVAIVLRVSGYEIRLLSLPGISLPEVRFCLPRFGISRFPYLPLPAFRFPAFCRFLCRWQICDPAHWKISHRQSASEAVLFRSAVRKNWQTADKGHFPEGYHTPVTPETAPGGICQNYILSGSAHLSREDVPE